MKFVKNFMIVLQTRKNHKILHEISSLSYYIKKESDEEEETYNSDAGPEYSRPEKLNGSEKPFIDIKNF